MSNTVQGHFPCGKLKEIFAATVGFHQKYSGIKKNAPGFDFETCSAQSIILPTPQPFTFP